ncbi:MULTISPECIES: Rne/Rng family ribonuclease [Bacillus cereus group]|uniref:Ribonuclease, Rne/Rng family n=2 Tax=Bacillus cytotoxicus TaxID=580165 RepID=A0AAX2CKW4_9BACI|nr:MULTISPECIES: Rne/Rng family ribonuclease [Bacillus cereus group]ABS23383.1 ribonuclease, Rne/Rng family [Bacillus cytotoxicus NVH 391-98]AWC29985.1 ribonuclease E/G [Bacillus cytotoxicus]AWC42121.1 ribonuclease E/G [Bacillus cytotoxicus]AWC46011.1 ribonuclease E/G [Bacillus cytotoxicus]AWC50052.1 ribonuclease E/G [Bacillus cytotoxicus]
MKTLYINYTGSEKRVAIEEKQKIVELSWHRNGDEEIVGYIYVGRVVRTIAGMNAAFVNIGLEKHAYLSYDDVPKAYRVHEGQAILVQVVKEAIDTKGPKLTANIEFTGKYVVYMPYDEMRAVSRKIKSQKKRKDLFAIEVEGLGGYIFRSACEKGTTADIKAEIEHFQQLFEELKRKERCGKAPVLVHRPATFLDRIFQENPTESIEKVVVDSREPVRELENKLGKEKVFFYREKSSMFSHYGIEREIEKALQKIVWLQNGSYLIIEQMETMTVIDVNTGKFTGKQDLQDTVVRTNEIAVEEIARQLRLRDIGGMILIDFINMKKEEDQERIREKLIIALQDDRTYTRVLGFTELGILEMTRKRKKQSLRDILLEDCAKCMATGYSISNETIAYELERELLSYSHMEDEAVLIAAPKAVQKIFLQKELQKNIPFQIYFKEEEMEKYALIRFGTKQEMIDRKNS